MSHADCVTPPCSQAILTLLILCKEHGKLAIFPETNLKIAVEEASPLEYLCIHIFYLQVH